jgi:hypothetical protein
MFDSLRERFVWLCCGITYTLIVVLKTTFFNNILCFMQIKKPPLPEQGGLSVRVVGFKG